LRSPSPSARIFPLWRCSVACPATFPGPSAPLFAMLRARAPADLRNISPKEGPPAQANQSFAARHGLRSEPPRPPTPSALGTAWAAATPQPFPDGLGGGFEDSCGGLDAIDQGVSDHSQSQIELVGFVGHPYNLFCLVLHEADMVHEGPGFFKARFFL